MIHVRLTLDSTGPVMALYLVEFLQNIEVWIVQKNPVAGGIV